MSVILVGYFCSPTGVGQGARNAAKILNDHGLKAHLINIESDFDDPILTKTFDDLPKIHPTKPERVVCFVNADMWGQHIVENPRIPKNYDSLAGVWSWELEHIPDYFDKTLQSLDQVFAVSNWSAESMSNKFGISVDRLVCLDFKRLLTNLVEEVRTFDHLLFNFLLSFDLNISNNQYLYSFFDFASVMERKNPKAILEIWNSINSSFLDHYLVLKCLNANENQRRFLQELVVDTPRVLFLWDVLPYNLQLSLVRNAALFISLHRSEGLGFGPLEAASFDVPVIFTNYGGFCELMPPGHFPVSWEYKSVGENASPYPKEAIWADPNYEDAKLQIATAINQLSNGSWEMNSASRKKNYMKTVRMLELETFQKLTLGSKLLS